MLCRTCEHARTNLLAIVKREDVVCVALARKRAMRTGLAFDLPADAQQRLQKNAGANR